MVVGTPVSSPDPSLYLRARSLRASPQSSQGFKVGMRAEVSMNLTGKLGRDRMALSHATQHLRALTALGSWRVDQAGPHGKP